MWLGVYSNIYSFHRASGERTYMTVIEEQEIEIAEEKWAHEVIEELEDEEALEEHFQCCIKANIPESN
jgi:hypothetical protein